MHGGRGGDIVMGNRGGESVVVSKYSLTCTGELSHGWGVPMAQCSRCIELP